MKHFLLSVLAGLSLLAFPTVSEAGDKDGDSFTFIQISDPQLGFFEDNRGMTEDSLNLETAVAQINRLKPAFVVVTGDMVNFAQSAEQKQCYRKIISKIDKSIPVWHIPGNHDIGNKITDEAIQRYIQEYGYQRFSFRYGGCAFIGINSFIIKNRNESMEEEQYRWLERQLKKVSRDASEIFVFSHYPVFMKSFDEKTGYSNFSPEDRDRYWSLFTEYGVKAVIAGHLHATMEAEHEGIGMYTTGPVGRPLGKGYSGAAVWKVSPAEGTYSGQYLSLAQLSELPAL